MRSLARIAVIGAAATVVAVATSTAAVAEDATIYAGQGAKVRWVANGDHMYITDTSADGHSAVGSYQLGSTQYFYWNSEGNGTTRHVNLDLPENRLIGLAAMLGEWQGTATGGLLWNTFNSTSVSTS